MKNALKLVLLLPAWLAACTGGGAEPIPVTQLPDPSIYGIRIVDLPEVGLNWQQTYNQTDTKPGYKWAYLAYQAYEAGNLATELEAGFAVNNDIVLYETDVSRQDLPKPPEAMGNIQDIAWKSATQPHQLGDKSAVWKTALGEWLTPVWWLEFYQGHAYVRISLLGFPDQIAPALLFGLGDMVAKRLPETSDELRKDVATSPATQTIATPTPAHSDATPSAMSTYPTSQEPGLPNQIIPLTYTAPPGETGMVTFFDDGGGQLTDGIKGTNDILADLGEGEAQEWVGWTNASEPITLTFSMDDESEIARVEIGFNHRDGLGIFPPRLVRINGTNFEISADEVPNNGRKDLVFKGPFNGDSLEIVLYHQGRGWILVDEVSFYHP